MSDAAAAPSDAALADSADAPAAAGRREPQPSLDLAMLAVFDGDGRHKVRRSEWSAANAALGLKPEQTGAWEELPARLGLGAIEPGEAVDFGALLRALGERGPCEGFTEELLRRLTQAFVSMALRVSGLEEALDQTVRRAERTRVHQINSTLRTWKQRHSSKAFRGWRDHLQGQKEALAKMARRWRSTTLATAWRGWSRFVAQMVEQRAAVARAVARTRHQLVAATHGAWQETARASAEARRAALARAVGRWVHKQLAAYFLPWLKLVAKARAAKELQRRALVRLTHGLLSSCFWTWSENAKEQVARRQALLTRVYARMQNVFAYAAFSTWRDNVRESVGRRHALFSAAIAHFRGHNEKIIFDAWCEFVGWKHGLCARVFALSTVVAACFRSWRAMLREAKEKSKSEWVLEGLELVGSEWLLQSLGDILPSLLPDHSNVLASMQHELATISRGHKTAAAASAASAASTASAGGAGGAGGAGDAGGGAAEAAVEEGIDEVRAGVQDTLVRLVEDRRSGGGARLLAFARAQDSQATRWDRATSRLETELEELRERSLGRGEALEAELEHLQRYVVEQTKAYLSATSNKGDRTSELESQLQQLAQTAAALAEKVVAVDARLEHKPDVQYCVELSQQLQQLSSKKAGREELQALVDLLQKPSVVVNKLNGPYVLLQESQRVTSLPKRPLSGTAGAALSRPRSAQPPSGLDITPGSEFEVVGRDGALYRGQHAPLLEAKRAHARPSSARPAPPSSPRAEPASPQGHPRRISSARRRVNGRPQRAFEAMFVERQQRGAAEGDGAGASAEQRRLESLVVSIGDVSYLEGRALLLSLERLLVQRRDVVSFAFGPAAAAHDGVARAEHAGGREMWLQWVAGGHSLQPGGWAFFEPTVRHTVGLESRLQAAAPQPPEVIMTQRRSLADFVAHVEGQYRGYSDLLRIVHGEQLLWSRQGGPQPQQAEPVYLRRPLSPSRGGEPLQAVAEGA